MNEDIYRVREREGRNSRFFEVRCTDVPSLPPREGSTNYQAARAVKSVHVVITAVTEMVLSGHRQGADDNMLPIFLQGDTKDFVDSSLPPSLLHVPSCRRKKMHSVDVDQDFQQIQMKEFKEMHTDEE